MKFDSPLVPDPGLRYQEVIAEWKVASLPPGAFLERFLGLPKAFIETNRYARIRVEITFLGHKGDSSSLSYQLDLASMVYLSASGKTISDIGTSVKEIADHLKGFKDSGLKIQKPAKS
ncbi:hypothetical protein L0U85_18745 [Glycomyces sp. L485]|uniref:hypothetical protein n=1 Tax=Glycomyces sp. L485 TaxID=2909235 RepID=UPI001F4B417C|nr:hypothetical protein [Glycomyces sp. L485]MCH7232876.1 hypothetical protein [Glycomyces sp. L485]